MNEYPVNLGRTRRGLLTVGGKTIKAPTLMENIGRDDPEFQSMAQYLEPGLDMTVREIMHEIEEDRYHRKLKPFVEGEPIGVLPRLVRKPRLTEAQFRKERNKRLDRQQEEMLTLRAKNNRTMKEVLEWESIRSRTSQATPPSAAI